MLRVEIVETAMTFTGSGFAQTPLNQAVHILEGVTIGDALIQGWRDEVKSYRDEIIQGKFLGDELVLASGKAYEVKLKAVPTGFELWL
ncbi:hypothetical protein E4630_12080 [Aeromonas hydrophila]|uniref:hypothetical protein n=1 Tax=Aeromonas hydrophila TaxID=644 RepID=UPI00107EAEEF|nr:hypothetical protein [Aeromonas hydrophila]QBX71539.1 hypothetical protein E4625_12300 [Aeromonas hydrophila]QBX76239.1 hypothetical protein E4630_12080 [Aeromonas hydrophila]